MDLEVGAGVQKLAVFLSIIHGKERREEMTLPRGRAERYVGVAAAPAELIRSAAVFFVATADPRLERGPQGEGPVNVSPRGGVPLHIIAPDRVAFLDYAGSGNETARHSLAGGPITVMVCSFGAEDAAIVQLYGRATITPLADSPLAERLLAHPAKDIKLPLRQVVEVEID